KPGAEVTVRVCLAAATPAASLDFTNKTPLPLAVAWEYWNGSLWQALPILAGETYDGDDPDLFKGSGTFRFRVPDDVAPTKVNEQEARWIRARIESGGYGFTATAIFDTHGGTSTLTFVVPQAPALAKLRLGYAWEYGPFPAERVLTYNDFQYADRTEEAKWP